MTICTRKNRNTLTKSVMKNGGMNAFRVSVCSFFTHAMRYKSTRNAPHPVLRLIKLCYFCCSMIQGKKIIAVLPAYNAALTLKQTYDEIPFDIVDDVVLVDD